MLQERECMANILVCDDERSICELLDIALRRENYRVETVNSGEAAKRKIDGALYDVIVTDIKMPNIDGIEVLRYAHQADRKSTRLNSSHSQISYAVFCLKKKNDMVLPEDEC